MDERDPSPIGAIFIWIAIFGLCLAGTIASANRFGEPFPLLIVLSTMSGGGAVGATAGRPSFGLIGGLLLSPVALRLFLAS